MQNKDIMQNPASSILNVSVSRLGIPYCVNCVGFHPHEAPKMVDFFERLHNPQRSVMRKHIETPKVMGEYKDKSCMMCGRTYDSSGELDESWEMTAKRVKEELTNAGIFGTTDNKVKEIVAKCRKSFTTLLRNRFAIPIERWQYLTFSGQLAFIITVAQEARKKHGDAGTEVKGMVEL